jgi:DHA2 family multidrug resistance protein
VATITVVAVAVVAAAEGVLNGQLMAEARLWAFVDVFRWMAILAFLCVGIIWLFRKVKPGQGPAGAHSGQIFCCLGLTF